jgi:hypothetical protein
MYQTKVGMSTGAHANRIPKVAKSRFGGTDQAVFGSFAPITWLCQPDFCVGWTWVTWPILRPGLAAPLP